MNVELKKVSLMIICIFALIAVFVIQSNISTQDVLKSNTATTVPDVPYVTNPDAFISYLKEELEKFGPETVQKKIREKYKDEPYDAQHMSLHYFGEMLYELKGVSGLSLCEDWYGFGCYHGFLLVAIEYEGYEIVPDLDSACIERHGHTMETETCQHGIGHGLTEASARNPLKAIEACDLVADVYPKLGCASGVFMEYFAPTESDKRTQAWMRPPFDKDNPLNVCSEFTGLSLATCLFEIQSWWQDVGKLTPQNVEALCNSVDDQEAREFCLIGYGNLKGPYVLQALPYCDALTDPESNALCRAGVLWSAEHHYDSPEPMNACSNLSKEYSDLCFKKGRFTCEVERNCMI